ncbi:MAG: hypothetical protein CM15mP55_1680 [Hyphomicrobiales bacterium]|nr:MAG: hypothetical protein CM15mP55_1680 [Hyphomicrobiales bacterium]
MRHVAGEFAVENRLSPHTVTSYARDLTQFLDFWPTIMPALLRWRICRRCSLPISRVSARGGTVARKAAPERSVSGLRNFARFLERRDTPVSPAFNLLSVPKQTQSAASGCPK